MIFSNMSNEDKKKKVCILCIKILYLYRYAECSHFAMVDLNLLKIYQELEQDLS